LYGLSLAPLCCRLKPRRTNQRRDLHQCGLIATVSVVLEDRVTPDEQAKKHLVVVIVMVVSVVRGMSGGRGGVVWCGVLWCGGAMVRAALIVYRVTFRLTD
jgi:hypothetical protein